MILINKMLIRWLTFSILFLATINICKSQIVSEYIDFQIHPTMHFQFSFFGKGLEFFDESKPPKFSYKHLLKNVNYANFFKNNKGTRIFVIGAMNSEWARNPAKARRNIVKQLDYVNKFVADNPNDFVIAKTPQEVRDYVKNTSKTIFVYSIEGGQKLIKSQEDANFWASKGISFITLVHIRDSEYGGAAILPMFATKLINLKAKKGKNEKGLTDLGKQTIIWLANAGILTDITHMNDKTRRGALQLMDEHKLPPISTHDGFKPIQNHSRALSEDDIYKVYKNNGFISLPISGYSCQPYKPNLYYQNVIDSLNLYCANSVDTYLFTYLSVKNYIENKANLGYNDTLSETQKVNYCIGFQSDFNGWLNHSRPRVGKNGCFPINSTETYEEIELKGMPHPGLLDSQWRYFIKKGADVEPIKKSAEKFLQLWQFVIDNKGNF